MSELIGRRKCDRCGVEGIQADMYLRASLDNRSWWLCVSCTEQRADLKPVETSERQAEHTPEPWVGRGYNNYAGLSIFSEKDPGFGCITERWEDNPSADRLKEIEANQKRIIECVNACAILGGNPKERIEELREGRDLAIKHLAAEGRLRGAAEQRLAALVDILGDSLSCFKITQTVSDYPKSHWCRKAEALLDDHKQPETPGGPEGRETADV